MQRAAALKGEEGGDAKPAETAPAATRSPLRLPLTAAAATLDAAATDGAGRSDAPRRMPLRLQTKRLPRRPGRAGCEDPLADAAPAADAAAAKPDEDAKA